MGTLPRGPLAGEDIVVTTPVGGEPRLSFRSREAGVSVIQPLPLNENLLALGRLSLFGSEGRCRGSSGASASQTIQCSAGEAVAGAVMTFDERLPRNAALNLSIGSASSPGFKVQLVARGAEADHPVLLQPRTNLDVAAVNGPVQVVFVAPKGGGQLALSETKLVPVSLEQASADVSAWAWDPGHWRQQGEQLITAAKSRGLKRLFVSLDIQGGKLLHAERLSRFNATASAAGIQIEAVEGDPNLVLPTGRAAALQRAKAIASFQKLAPRGQRLAGVQYDIEPYTLAQWGGSGAASYRSWKETILLLARELGGPIDLVLPFWIANEEGGRDLLGEVAPHVRSVTIMSYRTDLALLSQIAEPLLAWGVDHRIPIRIGLEAGTIADETEQLFTASASGTLAVTGGETPKVALLADDAAVPGAAMFKGRHLQHIPGGMISFQGDEERMRALAMRAAPLLAAWPSFAGFAFHGLKWSD